MKIRFLSLFLYFAILMYTHSQESIKADFMYPNTGDIINSREDFEVKVQIEPFDKDLHHWVALATVKNYDNKWDRVLELYKKNDDLSRNELINIIKDWKLNQFWPKFYVSQNIHSGRVFDGGQNPLKGIEPQPMVLIILRIDNQTDKNFKKWLRDGVSGKGYPGIDISTISKEMILKRCEIFFP